MSDSQHSLIDRAMSYYQQGDFSLGYRTLLDTALNTNNPEVYKNALDFVAIFEATSDVEKPKLLEDFKSCSKFIREHSNNERQVYGNLVLKGNGLMKNYNRGRFVLGPVDIELRRGDIFGLVGENGNGKTTLLTILALLNKTSAGTVDYFLSDHPKTKFFSFDLKCLS